MSTDTIPACAEGRTAETLSEWRDGALSPAEAARLGEHVAGCAACQQRLAEYDAIADGLRAIRVPAPIGGYGHNPRLLPPPAPRSRGLFSSSSSLSRRRTVGSLGAMAAVLLVALAFAQVFSGIAGRGGVSRTPLPATTTVSSTPIVLPPLAWSARAPLPDGIQANGAPYLEVSSPLFGLTMMIAPSDGATAYVCSVQPPPMNGMPTNAKSYVFVTHDSGQTWSPILTISEMPHTTACTVSVDALNPALVVASSAYAFRTAPPSPNQSASYVSRDGGIHWERLPANQLIFAPATLQGVTYAIHETQTGTYDSEPITVDLAVSRDGMHTWTPLDKALVGPSGKGYQPIQFWLNPGSGALLLEAIDSATGLPALWHSEDSGAHWRQVGLPPATSDTAGYQYLVQSPITGQPWTVCLTGYDPTGQGQNRLACTSDNGAVWTPRAALAPPNTPPVKGKGTNTAIGAALVGAISDDGAVLAVAAQGVAADGSITGYTLFRLPRGASRWQSLGPIPEFTVLYAPAPGNGMLWALPAQGIQLDPHNRVFTVPYR